MNFRLFSGRLLKNEMQFFSQEFSAGALIREWAGKAANLQPVMWAGIAMMTLVAKLASLPTSAGGPKQP
jgi:hypothetical protein